MSAAEHQQPGLEVAPSYSQGYPGLEATTFQPQGYPGLEVAPDQNHYPTAPIPVHYGGEKSQHDLTSMAVADPSSAPKKSHNRLWWIIGGVVVVAVIIGAVVGGVVGSRNSHKGSSSSSSSSSPSPSPPNNPPSSSGHNETVEAIQPGSSLAVTGSRGNGDFSIRLFYQGRDNVLRFSDYASVSDKWASPVKLDGLAPKAKTPLAAGTWLYVLPPQLYLYYVDESSILRGQQFRSGITPATGDSAGINDFPMRIDGTSRLTGYHPHVLAQNTDGEMKWIHWIGEDNYENYTLGDAVGSSGSGMTLVSAATKFFQSGAFLYRNSAGYLSTYVGSTNGTLHDDWAWAQGKPLSGKSIPADTSIAAFVYSRGGNLVNTYSLYQDEDGVLQVIWQDDESGWKGPQTYDALAGADKGTNIACVTQAAWDQNKVTISTATDMNRCYFQSGGKVKEVLFDGKNWNDLGFLPID